MTYENLKRLKKEHSRDEYLKILSQLADYDLVDTYRAINDALIIEDKEEAEDIFALQDDINFVIVNRWVEEHDKGSSVLYRLVGH